MDVHEDQQHLQSELLKLESESSNDFPSICKMADIFLRMSRPAKCWAKILILIQQFKTQAIPVTQGLVLVDIMTKYYKSERYSNKTLKINYTKERSSVMTEIWDVLSLLSTSIQSLDDVNNSQIISLKMAYAKECLGNNQDSLSILSDLISSHAIESIDLSYVIFKAAIILKHIGQNKQAIEYFEFLVDDPPIQEGYNKIHVLSFLILSYEQSGDKYKVFLPKTYKDLLAAYTQETSGDKISTQNTFKKLQDIIKSPTLATSSEIWEILALQALEKCEYIMAVELLQQAVNKAPNKGKLLQILGEIYYLLNKKELSLKYCEKAVALLPQNADLRNLLLILNPDKYTEKLRSAPATRTANITEDDEEGETTLDGNYDVDPVGGGDVNAEESGNWMEKMKSKATETIQAIHENGVTATIIAPLVHKEKTNHTSTSTTTSKDKAKKVRKKSPTKHEKEQREQELRVSPIKAVVPKAIPAVENEVVTVSTKAKKPVLNDEAQRILRLVLSGNQNIHLYEPGLQKVANYRASNEKK